jgi:tetratricopeptide (TPR) repeat protein
MTDRINKLKAFIEKQPGDSFLQHALALEFVKLGDDNEARTIFENLLKQNPGYVGSYYHLGKLLERAGEEAAAIGIFEKGVEVARGAGDNHSLNELQGALDEIS